MHAYQIIFTGGGSLGPVTPLLAVAKAVQLQSPGTTVSWIGTGTGPERRLIAEAGIPFDTISAGKLRRYFSWRNLTDGLLVFRGFFEARRILKRIGADAVVSAGGYVAVPVAWAARSLGLPLHVHQQDVRPGLANWLSLPAATSMSVALESSLKQFKSKRPVLTGNPVRPEILSGSRVRAITTFNLAAGLPTVLVLGGGTGAAGLNQLVHKSLPLITSNAQVIHSTGLGKADPSAVATRYHQYELMTAELPDAYAIADLVVTRAGMGTITELAALAKPLVLVPMPGSHQEENAAAISKATGAPVLDELQTSPESFAALITGLLADNQRLASIGNRIHAMHREDAANLIAAIVLDAAKKNKKN